MGGSERRSKRCKRELRCLQGGQNPATCEEGRRVDLEKGPRHDDNEASEEEEVSVHLAIKRQVRQHLRPAHHPPSQAEEGRQRPVEPAGSFVRTLAGVASRGSARMTTGEAGGGRVAVGIDTAKVHFFLEANLPKLCG